MSHSYFAKGITMKRWWAVILCFAFLPFSAAFAQQAGDPATKEDVQKLFGVMHSRKQFDAVMDVMKRQLPALTKGALADQLPNATPEETARLQAFVNDSADKMFQNMPFDELMQAMIPAYQHHFTHGEMQELIQFYSSPLDKKLLAEMPAILTEYMQAATPIIQKWTHSQMADLQVSAEEFAKRLKEQKTPPAALSQPRNSVPASLSQPLQQD